MQQAQSNLAPYVSRLDNLRESMIKAIGVYSVNVLMQPRRIAIGTPARSRMNGGQGIINRCMGS